MKRSGPIQRTTRLRSTGRLKAVGATKLKKQKRYKAFLSSAVWKRIRKEALVRAGYRCEKMWVVLYHDAPVAQSRCPATEDLTAHHLTYARFGGKELPEDLQVLCRVCHDAVSALEGRRFA